VNARHLALGAHDGSGGQLALNLYHWSSLGLEALFDCRLSLRSPLDLRAFSTVLDHAESHTLRYESLHRSTSKSCFYHLRLELLLCATSDMFSVSHDSRLLSLSLYAQLGKDRSTLLGRDLVPS
jgi:hypothetical protein